MRTYLCFYKDKRLVVHTAEGSYAAQQEAAKLFKAKKSYEVTVVLADVPINTGSL
jgi:hypothetical protein